MILKDNMLFIILGIGIFILFALIGYLVDVYKKTKVSINNENYKECEIDSDIDINENVVNDGVNKNINKQFDNKDELLDDYDKMNVNS